MGVDPEAALGGVRFSLGHGTNAEDVEWVADRVAEAVAAFRARAG